MASITELRSALETILVEWDKTDWEESDVASLEIAARAIASLGKHPSILEEGGSPHHLLGLPDPNATEAENAVAAIREQEIQKEVRKMLA